MKHARLPGFMPVLVAIAAAGLGACGQADVDGTSGQIAAVVNGKEISVHRVSGALARSGESQRADAGEARAQALQQVIDQELLVQEALTAKLDRDPRVLQAIEDTRRQILARAHVERVIAASPAQSEEQAGAFYKENPALFERRRIYRVREYVVTVPQEQLDALKTAAAAAKSMDEVAAWLESRKLAFTEVTTRKPAEQIPLKILPRLLEMRDGQIAVFPASAGASVLQVVQTEEAPLSAPQAAPVIERFLLSRKRLEIARAEVEKLRAQAKIEYLGEFSPASPAPAATPGSEEDAHMERGIAGLK